MIVLLLNEERINLTPASTLTTRTSLVAGQANVRTTRCWRVYEKYIIFYVGSIKYAIMV